MVGSTQSTSGPTFVLNTIVADILGEIADELEKADDVNATAQKMLQKIAIEHKRVVFNGDNYTDEWVKEAAKRGLPNIRATVDSLKTIMDKENVNVFKKHNVLSEAELAARTEVLTILPGPLSEAELSRRLSDVNSAAIMKVGRHLQKIKRVIGNLGLTQFSYYVERASLKEQKVLTLANAPEVAPYFSMILVAKGEDPWL